MIFDFEVIIEFDDNNAYAFYADIDEVKKIIYSVEKEKCFTLNSKLAREKEDPYFVMVNTKHVKRIRIKGSNPSINEKEEKMEELKKVLDEVQGVPVIEVFNLEETNSKYK